MCVYSFTGILELDDSDDCRTDTRMSTDLQRGGSPTLAQLWALPRVLGIEGPQDRNNPLICNPLDFLFLLWPESLCDLIVDETNSYGRSSQIGWILIGMSY